MKQHITIEQLNELSEKGKQKYSNYCRKKRWKGRHDLMIYPVLNCNLPLLSIGQMIEFVSLECIPYDIWETSTEKNFCDRLWGVSKEKLESKGLWKDLGGTK